MKTNIATSQAQRGSIRLDHRNVYVTFYRVANGKVLMILTGDAGANTGEYNAMLGNPLRRMFNLTATRKSMGHAYVTPAVFDSIFIALV